MKKLEVYFTNLSTFSHRRAINIKGKRAENEYHPAVGLLAEVDDSFQTSNSKEHVRPM